MQVVLSVSILCEYMGPRLRLGLQLSDERKMPDWMVEGANFAGEGKTVDEAKFKNLAKRRKTYCDVTQNATEEQLRQLLLKHDNNVPGKQKIESLLKSTAIIAKFASI